MDSQRVSHRCGNAQHPIAIKFCNIQVRMFCEKRFEGCRQFEHKSMSIYIEILVCDAKFVKNTNEMFHSKDKLIKTQPF